MADFDEIKAAFWGDGTYDVHAPLTDALVREAEAVLGVRLPAALLDLLRVQNGGMVACGRRRYPTTAPTSWADDHVPLPDLMGIGHTKGVTSLLDVPDLVEEWELPTGVVPISGDGPTWVALDYRRTGEPTVVWLENGRELALAADFRSFVEGLTGR